MRNREENSDGVQTDDERSLTTLAPNRAFKVEILRDVKRNNFNDDLTEIIRSDILSFHASSKKFKAYDGIKNILTHLHSTLLAALATQAIA